MGARPVDKGKGARGREGGKELAAQRHKQDYECQETQDGGGMFPQQTDVKRTNKSEAEG